MRILLALLAVGTSVAAQTPTPPMPRGPRGSVVRLTLPHNQRVTGELLAVHPDSVWLQLPSQVRVLPWSQIQEVQVRRPGLGPEQILVWTVIGGLGSGAALTAACSTVDDANCGGVLAATVAVWGIVGGLAAAITRSPHRDVAAEPGILRPYARFPQGLPPSFGRPPSPWPRDSLRRR